MGFGVRAELLCGRYTASAFNDRQATEWPPHWARAYYALVDAWGADGSPTRGRALLEWLESLGDPEIFATESVARRSPVTHFVPVNDVDITSPSAYRGRYERLASALVRGAAGAATARKERDIDSMVRAGGSTPVAAAVAMLPERRGRQARYYPTVRPADPVVVYWWAGPADPEVPEWIESLDLMLSQVVRLGHSSSFVSLGRIEERPVGAPWSPEPGGRVAMRSTRPGLLRLLERDYADHKASRPRTMRSVTVRYRAPSVSRMTSSVPIPNTAGRWRVLGLVDPAARGRSVAVPGRLAAQLTEALRGAVLKHAPDPRLGLLSGHTRDGAPLTVPHASYLALPNVGHDRSTGDILGLAVMAPDGTAEQELEALDAALARWSGSLGRNSRWHTGMADPTLATLDPHRWSRSSALWVTATPVALGRHPAGTRRAGDGRRELAGAAAIDAAAFDIRLACGHVGLPEPEEVRVSLAPLLDGALPVHAYPPFTRGRFRRALVHAALTFREPVAGPLVVGSGRYLGLGLCLPVGGGT